MARNVTLCLGSQLDLFRGPVLQLCQEKNVLVPHYPLTTLTGGPLEFVIPPSHMYTDLSETRLYLKAKVLNSQGQAIADDSTVASTNLIFHAMFSKVDVHVGDRLITQSVDTYPWKATLETLLNFGREAKESQLSAIGYESDVEKRKEMVKGSKGFELMGPLHVDFFFQEKYLINGIPIRVKLTRTTPQFCLETEEASPSYSLSITQAILYVRRVKVSPSIEIAHAKAIEKGNALYPFHHTEMAVVPLPPGLRSVSRDNLFSGKVPRKLVIAMLSSDSYNGTYKSKVFDFTHQKVSRFELSLEGEPIADTPLTTDFDNKLYLRAHQNIFTALNKSYVNLGPDIDYEAFGTKYPLFCFDLTSDGCGNTSDHFDAEKRGSLRVSLTFSENLKKTTYVIFYAEFEKVLEITKSREVLL